VLRSLVATARNARKLSVKVALAALIVMMLAFGVSAASRSSGKPVQREPSFVPPDARRVESYLQTRDDKTVALLPSVGDGAPAGLTPDELRQVQRGIDAYNGAVLNGTAVSTNEGQESTLPLFGSLASTAYAWNSQWVSCSWWGCTFALSHKTTQNLINTINATPMLQLWSSVNYYCAVWFPPAAWACPILATDIMVAGKVFAWQLGNQDHGGGVYVYATYWKQWPGITSQ